MSDLISRQYVLNKLLRNNIFKAITNAEGQSAIDIVQNAPDAFQSYDNRLTALEIYNNLQNLDMCTYGQLCYLIIEENKKCGTTNADRIRNMDNAGLADYIYGVSEGTKPCVLCDGDCDFCEESPEQCKEKIVKWLENEVEDE